MKRFTFSFVLLIGLVFLFTQCGSADAGKKTADEFFSRIIKKDFEKAASMIERPFGDTTDFVQQVQWMENNPTNGQLMSFKKSIGFNTNISNGVTTVEIPYVLRYDKGDQTVNVVIKNRGSGNKIVSVQ
jgi:hypothetical protein